MPLKIISEVNRPSISNMEEDLESISAILKTSSRDFSTLIEGTSPAIIGARLLAADSYLNSLAKYSPEQQNGKRLLRHYVALVKRHQNDMWTNNEPKEKLNQHLKNISESIGEIACLHKKAVLASAETLPPNFNHSIKKWQLQKCSHPTRGGKVISKNQLGWVANLKPELTEPKSDMENVPISNNIASVATSNGTLFLNMTDLEYYRPDLMDVDHFIPSAQLISRLDEMVESMNYDPDFANEMQKPEVNDNYFIKENTGTEEKIVGNYYLHMAYHNSMDNLSLLLIPDNRKDKSAQDAIEWLDSHILGQEYRTHLEQTGKTIDKSDILYQVIDENAANPSAKPESLTLREDFTRWVLEDKRSLIKNYQLATELHDALRQASQGASEGKKIDRVMLKVQIHDTINSITSNNAESKGAENNSDGENSADTDDIAEEVIKDPRCIELKRQYDEELLAITREKMEQKNQKRFRPNPS